MKRALLGMMLACTPVLAAGADDLKVAQLEQDVRDLKRQVLALSRQLDEIRNRPGAPPARIGPTPGTAPTSHDAWVDAAKWQRLRVGMSELEVLGLLGPPTSMRDENGARLLLYAMEIGASGYLSGSVSLRERVVSGIQKPELK
jgi:outer membrane murein-binding lipoprotein Lpp